jgi:hypothetical protein
MSVSIERVEVALFAQIVPALLGLSEGGRVAVSLGGFRAKNLGDSRSDYDFRVYADRFKGPELTRTQAWADFEAIWQSWEHKGFRIDGAWCRRIADIDRDLTTSLVGEGATPDYDWTIWGYQLPTDIAHQTIVADPDGVLKGWKARLEVYPELLRQAILEKQMAILRYWRADYHYLSKIERRDEVFLAGLSAKLVHSIMQVLFALNRSYFPGDGWNLRLAEGLTIAPTDLSARIKLVLNPGSDADRWVLQRDRIVALIDDLEGLLGHRDD